MTESISTPHCRAFFRTVVLALASLVATSAFAQTTEPREGVNYTVVKPTQPTTAPAGKTEVIEFFGYWCPHCNDFEPVMSDWAKRNEGKVSMQYVPFAFLPAHIAFQKLYYTLDTLGVEKELRRKVFDAIHRDGAIRPNADAESLADWAAKNGLDRKKFVDAYNSFSVTTKVTRANQIAAAYGVTGVPMLGIGGKYLINVDARSIGNADVFLARVVAGK
jgi:thiol:disulfide interchange protein DsbA